MCVLCNAGLMRGAHLPRRENTASDDQYLQSPKPDAPSRKQEPQNANIISFLWAHSITYDFLESGKHSLHNTVSYFSAADQRLSPWDKVSIRSIYIEKWKITQSTAFVA